MGLETIPMLTEDSSLKHHQANSWKITFPLCHYRFSWFKWCHLRGKTTRGLFPSGRPTHQQEFRPTDSISTRTRRSHHKPQHKLSAQLTVHERWQAPNSEQVPCLRTVFAERLTALVAHHLDRCPVTVNLAPLGSIQLNAKILIKQLVVVWQCQNYDRHINPLILRTKNL